MTNDHTGDNDSTTLRYDLWVESALRSVIKQALEHIKDHGLPGDHHFYISFLTQEDGVEMPGRLRAQHPNDMTVVLQYQFDDLEVTDEGFAVTLSFGGVKEHLRIPFAAIISFADPSVSFALQLKMVPSLEDDELDIEEDIMDLDSIGFTDRANNLDGDELKDKADETKTGEVIALDAFRKK